MINRDCVNRITFLIVMCSSILHAQLSVSNQLEYSYWNQLDRNILENWLDVSWQQDAYSFGFRHELNQPPDPFIFPLDSLLDQEELTFRYAEVYQDNFTLTVGNFYSMFGRGMTLRTYEDRSLRVDNNIDGLKVNYYGDRFEITALGGRMRDKYNRREDSVYGADGEYNVSDNITLGASFVRNQLSDTQFNDLRAGRISASVADFDVYAEVAHNRQNDTFSYYATAAWTGDNLSVVGEYKDYNRLTFVNSLLTEYNAPPALSRQHTYTLLNRHPHQLNTSDERGYQMEGIYSPSEALEVILNYSYTESHNNNLKLFEEYYGQLHYEPNEEWNVEGGLGWNFDFSTRTKNWTPLVMAEYRWSDIDELHLELQHQHVISTLDKSEFDDEMIVLEYTRSPFLNFALVGEYSNRYKLNTIQDETSTWLYGQITLAFLENQQISILYGSRQAGFVCVGGVCRLEPEFKGVEIKLINRF